MAMVSVQCTQRSYQCRWQDLFRSRYRDRDLDKMSSSALESRDNGLETTTLVVIEDALSRSTFRASCSVNHYGLG